MDDKKTKKARKRNCEYFRIYGLKSVLVVKIRSTPLSNCFKDLQKVLAQNLFFVTVFFFFKLPNQKYPSNFFIFPDFSEFGQNAYFP